MSTCATSGAGNGATRARLEARRRDDLAGAATRALLGAGGGRDLRRVGPPVAGHEREHAATVADEEERLDDLPEVAADRLRRSPAVGVPVAELLDARVYAGSRSTAATRSTGSGQRSHGTSSRARRSRAVVEPSASSRSTAPAARARVDRERHQRLARLARPRDGHVGDVDAPLAEHRPDAADDAGTSS